MSATVKADDLRRHLKLRALPYGREFERRCGNPQPHIAVADDLRGYDPPLGHDVVIDGFAAEPQVVATAEPEDIVTSHAQIGLLEGDSQLGARAMHSHALDGIGNGGKDTSNGSVVGSQHDDGAVLRRIITHVSFQ